MLSLALLAACGKDSGSRLQVARALEAKEDYTGAIAEITRSLRDEPQSRELRYHLARMYSLTFDMKAAEYEFRKARELGVVEGGRVALGLGVALAHQRKYREVITEVTVTPAFEQPIVVKIHALRGNALLNLDHIDEAKKELRAAQAIDPASGDAVLLQARFTAGRRDLEGALALVENLLSREPRNVDAWIHKAELLTVLKRHRDAIEAFGRALDIRPTHFTALSARAGALVQSGRLGAAQKDIDLLRKSNPAHPVTAYLQGQIHYWRGEYREALDMAQAALKADERDDRARLLSGMAHMMSEALAQAEHELAGYMTRNPRDLSVHRVLADLRTEMSQRARNVRALASVHADELRKASARAVMGDTYLRELDYSPIAEWLTRTAAARPPDPLIVVREAQRRFSKEQVEWAASDLERSATLGDKGALELSALVLAQLARSDAGRAMDAAIAMETRAPNNAQAAMLAGFVLLERNQVGEAEKRFDDALRLDASLVAAVAGRARADIAGRRIDLARKRFDEFLKRDPDNLHVLMIWARLEESAGRQKEARELLNRAIGAHPSRVEPRVALVSQLRRENDKAVALSAVEEMLSLQPEDPLVLEMAANVQLWNGQQERGLETLRRLVKVRPASAESHFKLADAQSRAGLAAEANSSLQRALSLPIDEPDARALTIPGLRDNDRTLLAIESARKSFVRTGAASRTGTEGNSTDIPVGGGALYDALSRGGK